MADFLEAIGTVVSSFVTSFGTVATSLLTNTVVIYIAGLGLATILVGKVISIVRLRSSKKENKK